MGEKDVKTFGFVLAYPEESENAGDVQNGVDADKLRKNFEQNLRNAGLTVENCKSLGLKCDKSQREVCFTKITVGEEVMFKYAEILKLQMPLNPDKVKITEPKDTTKTKDEKHSIMYCFRAFCQKMVNIKITEPKENTKKKDEKHPMMYPFCRKMGNIFDKDNEHYFRDTHRIFVISYILDRQNYNGQLSGEKGDLENGIENTEMVGIKNLIAQGVYSKAYPLHNPEESATLCNEWGDNKQLWNFQPITEIMKYFGTNVALYYAWLGFYTRMLIFPAVLSLVYMAYGLITLPGDSLSQSICSSNIIMCPLCDKFCPFWNLKDTCLHARMSHLIDNTLTPFYCAIVSVWSAVYFQLWKRYNAELVHRWGLQNFDIDDEPDRPQFTSEIAERMKHLGATKKGIKYSLVTFSYSVVIFWVLLVFAATTGILVYKLAVSTSNVLWAGTSYNKYFVAFTCSVIDVICIYILDRTYGVVMIKLTDIEMRRTQTEYDNSLALKLYIFQFANRFSSTLYIAFFKGKFVGSPSSYNRIFGYRQEECQPGGCLSELSIQLLTLIIGLHVLPLIMDYLRTIVAKVLKKGKAICDDYILCTTNSTLLFYDYLEMMMQYGYLTIFIAAFPIAPLIAVLNNLFEIRRDARKMLLRYQRPVPQRAKDIGIWSHMIETTYQLGVYSTGFILAFSTNLIPKFVHWLRWTHLNKTTTYLDHTLAVFNTSDFDALSIPSADVLKDVKECRYREYRNDPRHNFEYDRPIKYWQVLAAKFAFMLIYLNLVALLQRCIQWLLPDTPNRLQVLIRKENKLITEIIIQNDRNTVSMNRDEE